MLYHIGEKDLNKNVLPPSPTPTHTYTRTHTPCLFMIFVDMITDLTQLFSYFIVWLKSKCKALISRVRHTLVYTFFSLFRNWKVKHFVIKHYCSSNTVR